MLSLVICFILLILKADAIETDVGAVIVTANNRSLTYVTNLSVNDGEANYTYEDGEDLYFSCEKAYVGYLYLSDHLHLEYYNAGGILLFQTKPRVTRHIFRSVLKSNNDKYYLDCIRTNVDTERQYSYRTTFYMKKRELHADADHHAMTLSVNGQKLTVITNNGKSSYYYDNYLFRYIDGEVLNVTCRKTDKNMRGTLTFYNDYDTIAGYDISSVVKSPLEGYISLNVSTTNINRKILNFVINNSNIQKPIARLLFLSDFSGNGVRIRGLPRHNILYQYTNDFDKWTIEYEYSVNDTLTLTCVSVIGSIFVEKARFHWEFNGETSISAAFLSPTMMIIVSNKMFTKTLDATYNGKTINCVYIPNPYFKTKTEKVEIILRLKPGAKSADIISSKTLSHVKISEKSSLLILGSSLGAVVVILGLTGVACWYVRTRNTRSNIETPYGEMYQNNSPTPQFTNECDNQYDVCYSEIAPNRQTYYETPGSIKNNMDPEDHYTEIDLKLKHHKLVVPGLVYDVPSYQK